MKRVLEIILTAVATILVALCAGSFYLVRENYILILVLIVALIVANTVTLIPGRPMPGSRTRVLGHGVKCLEVFLLSTMISIGFQIWTYIHLVPGNWTIWLIGAGLCALIEGISFWNGIISVYITSTQMGIKHRVLGIVLGMIPLANIVMLGIIIRIARQEVVFESEKYVINQRRKALEICKTKYPIVMVHGVFFRDTKYFNYWGRIPEELKNNGARIFYGEHQSAASVANSGDELAQRIQKIVEETGCQKVNIIAHSKGGLDCRYAISNCGIAERVASLITINTPHRGCKFADYLLTKVPESLQKKLADTYNKTLRKLGDPNPDFMAAVWDLTEAHCKEFDRSLSCPSDIFTYSYGSKLNHATGGKFPLNFSYNLVKHFDGDNDGLVGEESFKWGENYRFISTFGSRGISHGDMIDLNRENIPGFDVREFYVKIVKDLKERGL